MNRYLSPLHKGMHLEHEKTTKNDNFKITSRPILVNF